MRRTILLALVIVLMMAPFGYAAEMVNPDTVHNATKILNNTLECNYKKWLDQEYGPGIVAAMTAILTKSVNIDVSSGSVNIHFSSGISRGAYIGYTGDIGLNDDNPYNICVVLFTSKGESLIAVYSGENESMAMDIAGNTDFSSLPGFEYINGEDLLLYVQTISTSLYS